MGFFDIADISTSGMTAEQTRLDVIAQNIANAETTHTPEGGPYKRRSVQFMPIGTSPFATIFSNKIGGGVRVNKVSPDNSPPRLVFDPNHPDADTTGYVKYPNINISNEMVDLLSASRAYEANVTMFNLAKSMEQRTLDIGR